MRASSFPPSMALKTLWPPIHLISLFPLWFYYLQLEVPNTRSVGRASSSTVLFSSSIRSAILPRRLIPAISRESLSTNYFRPYAVQMIGDVAERAPLLHVNQNGRLKRI